MQNQNYSWKWWIKNFDLLVTGFVLALLTLMTFLGVIFRYCLGSPIAWLEEFQLACMIWIVFGGAGAAFRTGGHVAVEIVVDLMPKALQRVVEALISLVFLAVSGFLLVQSVGFVQMFFQNGRSTNILDIPYKWIYMIVPVSFALMIINYFYSLYMQHHPDGGEEEAENE